MELYPASPRPCDRRSQSSFTVVDVTNRTNIKMWFFTLKFRFAHRVLLIDLPNHRQICSYPTLPAENYYRLNKAQERD